MLESTGETHLTRANALCSIGSLEDHLPPAPVGQIPAHRFSQPSLKIVFRLPAELALNFGAIDRIPAIVTGAIRNKHDELFTGPLRRGLHLVKQLANGPYDMDVRALVMAADIVSFADRTALDDRRECARMILDIKPVTNVPVTAMLDRGFVGFSSIEIGCPVLSISTTAKYSGDFTL